LTGDVSEDSLKYWMMDRKYWWYEKPKERLKMWLVWKLPRGVCAWATIRVMSHATTGEWRNQHVPELTAMDALQRWDIPRD
jgi:hypothetical protein